MAGGQSNGDRLRARVRSRPQRFDDVESSVYPHQGRLDGLNTYGAPMKIGTGFHCGYFRWIGAGDFTGDGRADVYVTTADAKCFLYPNTAGLNGLDTLGERIHIGGKRPEVMYDSLALTDLDGDGKVDCFGRQVGTGNVDLLLNGSFVRVRAGRRAYEAPDGRGAAWARVPRIRGCRPHPDGALVSAALPAVSPCRGGVISAYPSPCRSPFRWPSWGAPGCPGCRAGSVPASRWCAGSPWTRWSRRSRCRFAVATIR